MTPQPADSTAAAQAELDRLHREIAELSASLRESRHQHLVQTEKLAAVGELIAGIAHELNNPLAVMLGYVDLLTRELGPDTWSVRLEVDLILQQIARSRKIIDSLLRIARPMDDIGVLEPADLHELVEECLGLVPHQAPGKTVEVRTDLRASQGVRIGRHDLQQVILNLIVNALQAVEATQGRVEIRSWDWEGQGIIIAVRDTGPGIPPELSDRVFRPFFTTKGAGRGTGLGLSVSTGLIRRYGGALTLEATCDQGTEFRIWVRGEPIFDEDDNWLTRTLVSSLEARPRDPPKLTREVRPSPSRTASAAPERRRWPRATGLHAILSPLILRSCSYDERSPAWSGDRTNGHGA